MTLLSALALAATSIRIRKRSETTGYGDYFDIDAGQFTATAPDAKPLTRDGQTRHYTSIVGAMEDYSGIVEVFYYQNEDLGDGTIEEKLVASEVITLAEGVPVPTSPPAATLPDPEPAAALSKLEVARHRTWELRPCSTGGSSTKVLQMPVGSVEWLSMDFSGVLDESDSVDAVVSAVDLKSVLAIDQDDKKVSANRREVHIKPTGYGRSESKIKVTISTAQGQTVVATGVVVGE